MSSRSAALIADLARRDRVLGRERRLGVDDALLHGDGLVVLVRDEFLACLRLAHVWCPPGGRGRMRSLSTEHGRQHRPTTRGSVDDRLQPCGGPPTGRRKAPDRRVAGGPGLDPVEGGLLRAGGLAWVLGLAGVRPACPRRRACLRGRDDASQRSPGHGWPWRPRRRPRRGSYRGSCRRPWRQPRRRRRACRPAARRRPRCPRSSRPPQPCSYRALPPRVHRRSPVEPGPYGPTSRSALVRPLVAASGIAVKPRTAPAESNRPATATGIVLSRVMETPPHRELGFACRNEPTAKALGVPSVSEGGTRLRRHEETRPMAGLSLG